MADAVRAQVPGVEVLVEPSARNTAPAVAWAAVEVEKRGGDRFAVLPSDHLVRDEAAFRATMGVADDVARAGALVTIGLRPTRPETGFGWIEPGEGTGPALPVSRFVEKPPLAVAERLLAAGCLWNAGMFAWRVDTLLDALPPHLPGIAGAVDALRAGAAVEDVWDRTEATSIDHGLLERVDGLRVVPAELGWSDVGSWAALDDVLPPADGGAALADALVAVRSAGNLVHAPGKLVALLGVEGLVVVDTPDALLVARRDDPQAMRELVAEVERRGLRRYQ
jgi:mannose-1-phosphate guanylyltransferase